MDVLLFREHPDELIDLGFEPTEIRPAGADGAAPPPASPDEEAAYTHFFANARRNGRVPVGCPDGRWERADTMALNKHASGTDPFPAQAVLHAEEKVLVQQDQCWKVYGLDGTSLGRGPRAKGDITLDVENNRFYTNDDTGYIRVRALPAADFLFDFFPLYGRGYERSVLKTRGDRMWIVGRALPAMSHRQEEPTPLPAVLEVHDLGETLQTDRDGLLTSNQRLQTLFALPEKGARETLMLASSMIGATEEGFVMTTPDHIFRIDDSLEVTADLQGAFTPLDLSLDEAGRAYVPVQLPAEDPDRPEDARGGMPVGEYEGPRALWGVTPEGQRFLNVPLPERAGAVAGPPLIGYDHTAYVLLGKRVVAIGPTGEVRWRHRMGAPVQGGIVTADHDVIVTAGSRVWALTSEGERRILWKAPEGPLRTPPVLVSPDRLYVASASTLYHLTPVE